MSQRPRGTSDKRKDLAAMLEVATMWGMKKVTVIPVVIGALGSVSKEFDKFEMWTCAKHTIIRNNENIEVGVRNLKKMEMDFETFNCLLQLAFQG